MATIKEFEELEIWQIARIQTNSFNALAKNAGLSKDFELRNQMNSSSGSVMDCIAEGFERSGKKELKNFLVIAKGSNGEFRLQLYRCLDRNYVSKEEFEELLGRNAMLGKKLMGFISYLQNTPYSGQARR